MTDLRRRAPTAESPAEPIGPRRLGDNLRRAIKASGLTHQSVAERTELDPTVLAEILAGTHKVSSLQLALICTATGTDVLGMLEAEPFHGPSYRMGLDKGLAVREALRAELEALREDHSCPALCRPAVPEPGPETGPVTEQVIGYECPTCNTTVRLLQYDGTTGWDHDDGTTMCGTSRWPDSAGAPAGALEAARAVGQDRDGGAR